MSDAFALQNVVRLILDGNQWCALIGQDLQRGLAGFSDTPLQAVLLLAAAMREKGWILDPTFSDATPYAGDPNVFALGVHSQGWIAVNQGPRHTFSYCSYDPCIALVGLAISLDRRRHLYEANNVPADFAGWTPFDHFINSRN